MSLQNFNLEKALQESVVCQRRTGARKQFVFIQGDRVYKGPYTQDKINRIKSVSSKLQEWNAPFVVHPYPETFSSQQGLFISYPNLSKDYPQQCEQHTEFFSGIKYNVLIRSGLVKLGDVILSLDWIGPYIPHLVLSLSYMFVLEVGDTGLFNILVDTEKKIPYIIDYDDRRSTVREDEFFYFSRRQAKDKERFWLDHALPYYSTIANQIEALLPREPQLTERIRITVNLLRRYSPQPNIDELTVQMSQVAISTPSNIGKMKYKGPFGGSTTYSGYEIDIMKSALQKYIRRNIPDKALMAAFELYRMAELEGGRSIQSNLYN